MQYVGKVFSTVSQLYKELNPATLSGAVDIIVVEGKDGELCCSPFHVRFGLLQLLRPSDKAVQVIVNDIPAEFYMKVGESGEGFFVLETEVDVPSEFATSPLASPSLSFKEGDEDPDFLDLSGNVNSTEDHNKDGYFSAPSAHESDDEASAAASAAADKPPRHARTSYDTMTPAKRTITPLRRTASYTSLSLSPTAAAYNESSDNMWLLNIATESSPDPAVFSDDIVVGTRFKSRIMHQISDPETTNQLSQDMGVGINDSEVAVDKEGGAIELPQDLASHNRKSRPLSVVSDSAYVIETDPTGNINHGGAGIAASSVAPHAEWDWGLDVPHNQSAKASQKKKKKHTADQDHLQKSTHALDIISLLPAPKDATAVSNSHVLPDKEPRLDISLCGVEALQNAKDFDAQTRVFDENIVDAQMFESDFISVSTNPNLVFRIDGVTFTQSEPLFASLVSHLAFGRPLPKFKLTEPVSQQGESTKPLPSPESNPHPVVTLPKTEYTKHADGDLELSHATGDAKPKPFEHTLEDDVIDTKIEGVKSAIHENKSADAQKPDSTKQPGGRRWWQWGGGQRNDQQQKEKQKAEDPPAPAPNADTKEAISSGTSPRIKHVKSMSALPNTTEASGSSSGYMSDDSQASGGPYSKHQQLHYAKTLRLTSDQLKSLKLKHGANPVKFLVPSNNAYCEATIFLYRHDTQIVISDIDGTITKSDALGHLFNMVGKDWTHTGVAKLYTDISNNGYEILYLTSRAIGQADGTREFLENVKQSQYKLPVGPLLLSPDRLFTSLHREVIMRRPHEFKMACLRDIKNLFGADSLPFYAGFGNRITDAMSYRSVNVPVSRICTIDPSGEIKLELLPGYKSSYVKMNDLVDFMFPSLTAKLDPKFNDWEYWKQDLPNIDDDLAAIEAELEREKEHEENEKNKNKDKDKKAASSADSDSAPKATEPPASPAHASTWSTPTANDIASARQRSGSFVNASPTRTMSADPLKHQNIGANKSPFGSSQNAVVASGGGLSFSNDKVAEGNVKRRSMFDKVNGLSPFGLGRSLPSSSSSPARTPVQEPNGITEPPRYVHPTAAFPPLNMIDTHKIPNNAGESVVETGDKNTEMAQQIREHEDQLIPQIPPKMSKRSISNGNDAYSEYSGDDESDVDSVIYEPGDDDDDEEDDEEIDEETLDIMKTLDDIMYL